MSNIKSYHLIINKMNFIFLSVRTGFSDNSKYSGKTLSMKNNLKFFKI